MRKNVFGVVCGVIATGVFAVAALGADSAEVARVKAEIARKYPKLQIGEVRDTGVKGPLLEVSAGQNVIYYDQSGGNLIFGEIWTKDGVNITSKKREELVASASKGNLDMLKANLDKAVKIGSGKNVVIELTDPDCPYCRRMHEYWEKRTDVTRYVFLMPIPSLHPKAEAKAKFILASADQQKALRDVFTGKYDSISLPTAGDDKGRFKEHKELTDKSGLNGTPAYFVNGTFVHGANVPAIEKALN